SGRAAQGRVDTAAVGEYCCVQDHGPGAFGEGVGVQGTDASAVGVPDEGELVVAKSITQDVEVLHHVDRAHEGEEILTHHVRTAVGIGTGGFFEGRQVLAGHVPGVGCALLGVEQRVPVSTGKTFAPTHAARVEGDQVEGVQDPVVESGGVERRYAGDPGTSEVEYQGAPVFVRFFAGGVPDHRHLECAAVRLVGVERNGDGTALQCIHPLEFGTGPAALCGRLMGVP